MTFEIAGARNFNVKVNAFVINFIYRIHVNIIANRKISTNMQMRTIIKAQATFSRKWNRTSTLRYTRPLLKITSD